MIYLNLHKTSGWNNFQTNNKPIMKKFLTLLVVSALTVGGLRAQVENTPVCIDGAIHLLPKPIVNNSQYVFYSDNDDKEHTAGKYLIYNKNLEVVKELDLPESMWRIFCVNQEILADSDPSCISQSVFNSDDNFEFILPVITQVEGTSNYYRMRTTGFMLQNDKGETLQTVYFPNNFFWPVYDYGIDYDCILMDLGNVKYLKISNLIELVDDGERYYDLMYRLDSSGSSVLSLACPPMRVQAHPTVAGASEPVAVTFDSDNVSRIEVVSVKGSVAGTFGVTPGKHSATIDTSRLGKGMYIINVVENGTRSENCKIIIR